MSMNITAFSVRNYGFMLIVFAALCALGVSSLFNMPRGEDPDFTAPQFAVIVVYPGTSPEDMEQMVVKPIEKKTNELEDIKRVLSRIDDGLCIIRIDFKYESDPDDKYQEIVRELNAIRNDLPADLLSLDIIKFSPSDVNIFQAGLISEVAPYSELENYSRTLKEALEKVKSLKNVEHSAFPRQQVRVAVDLARLAANKVPLRNVFQAIQSDNTNIPGGAVEMGTKKLNVKTSGDYANLNELRNTVVQSTGKAIVRIRDIAEVSLDYEEEGYRARLDGRRAVWVTASRKMGTNVIAVDEQLKPVVAEFVKTLPPHIEFEQNFDNAEAVHIRLGHFARDFAIAILLVLITLVPLGFRASLVVMISIPLSLLMGLFMLDKFGFSINQLSIVGFVVALGLLVDDSIVVVENIERFLRLGYTRVEASVKATNQITLAVIGCTATLIFAFLPLLFLPEGSGDFIRSLPMAVVTTIFASLVVSLTIVPFLSSRLLNEKEHPEGNIFLRGLKRLINGTYRQLLHKAMLYPKTTLVVALAMFSGTLLLIPKVGFSLFPPSEKPMFLVNIEAPQGANLDETDRIARIVEKTVARTPHLRHFATNVGKGNPRVYYNVLQRNEAPNFAQLLVQLENEVRPEEKVRLIDTLRLQLTGIPNAKIEVKDFEQGPPVEAPIAIRIFGDNFDTLRHLSFEVERLIRQTDGAIYINNELTAQTQELRVRIDHDKAGTYGVPVAEIDRTIRLAVTGLPVGKFRVEGSADDYAINVTVPRGNKQDFSVFDRIYVSSLAGAQIPLRQLARVELGASPTGINHYDKERYTTVSAFLKTGYNTVAVTEKLLAQLDQMTFPKGYGYRAAGEVEAREESFGGIGNIILLTIFGLLGVLILEFKTFKSTLVVLSVIPLGIIGALWALFATGYTLSFVAVIGLIALAGIEVKNSILLVDYTEQLRVGGANLQDAIQEAGETRFVPIILTTLTAIGGLIPLALEWNPLYSPLAWVLIGGLISSTLLTRIVTPVLYRMLAPRNI